jgi:DNA mismatch endonuclease (patch repair protein)
MADVFSPQKRSQVMSRIRGRGNKDTEVALARLLRLHRISGWRRHQPIVGRPDFIFRKHRVAVFVDGCFWHRCPKHSNTPANNREFWESKLSANVKRDRAVSAALKKRQWTVIRVWEHDLKVKPRWCVRKILAAVHANRPAPTR